MPLDSGANLIDPVSGMLVLMSRPPAAKNIHASCGQDQW
jgi:hypothetical protein